MFRVVLQDEVLDYGRRLREHLSRREDQLRRVTLNVCVGKALGQLVGRSVDEFEVIVGTQFLESPEDLLRGRVLF